MINYLKSLSILMNLGEKTNSNLITLYKSQSFEQNLNPNQQNPSIVSLNLNNWKLLASGGANAVFHVTNKHLNKAKIDDSNELSSIKISKCLVQSNGQFNKVVDKKKDYEDGTYLLRVRQIKCLKKFIKIRAKMLVNVIKYQTPNENQDGEAQILKYSLQLKKLLGEAEQSLLKHQEKNVNSLHQLIGMIYNEFLLRCMDQSSTQEYSQQKQARSQFLPNLSKSIVRQSERFYFNNIYEEKSEDQKNKCVSQFFIFLMKELILQLLFIDIKKQKIKTNLQQIQLDDLVQVHIDQYPINLELQQFMNRSDETFLTFEENQLCFHQLVQQNERSYYSKSNYCNNHHEQSFTHNQISESKKQYQATILEVFQFKPKTILPDLYSEEFIDNFVQNLNSIQSHYGTLLKNCLVNKQQSLIKDSFHQNIQKINRKQNSISLIQETIDEREIKITSTRWFKKNCIEEGQKKKNQNPLCYFSNCLEKESEDDKQKIDFYNKKHLRKQQILCFKQIDMKQQTKNIQPERLSQQIDEVIIRYIHKSREQNFNCLYKSQDDVQCLKDLSVIDEILALQLIDLIDVIESQSDEKSTLHQKHKYVDILGVQRISHQLSLLASMKYNNEKESYIQKNSISDPSALQQSSQISHDQVQSNHNSNFHSNFQLCNSKIFPSRGLYCIGNLFDPKVYKKSKNLSTLLRRIIFQCSQINKKIEQILFHSSSFDFQKNKAIQFSKIIFHDNRNKILQTKQKLFHLLKFLVSLTWKDISFLIQEKLLIKISQNSLQEIKVQSNLKRQKSNYLESAYEIIGNLNKLSLEANRKIIKCKVIDYNLKTLENIDKNVQKDQQFLLYFLKYFESILKSDEQ